MGRGHGGMDDTGEGSKICYTELYKSASQRIVN